MAADWGAVGEKFVVLDFRFPARTGIFFYAKKSDHAKIKKPLLTVSGLQPRSCRHIRVERVWRFANGVKCSGMTTSKIVLQQRCKSTWPDIRIEAS